MADSSFHDGTRVVHAGLPPAEQGAPFLPGPTFAAPYHLTGDPADSPYGYGRYGNPTWTRYEQALGELEGGQTLVFASGMAAVSAVLLPRLKPGDVLLAASDCYLAVRSLATLDLRLERACSTALDLAERLAGRGDVEGVRYPGLRTDPAHELA